MTNARNTLIFLTFFLVNTALAQSIDKHFEGGTQGLNTILKNSIDYPKPSLDNQIEGVAIIQFNVDSNGHASSKFLTKLDDNIEKDLVEAIDQLMPRWKNTGQAYSFHLSVLYGITPQKKLQLNDQVLNYSQSIDRFSSAGKVEIVGIESQNILLPNLTELKERIADNITANELLKAYENLNQLIRYTPLDTILLQTRSFLEKELGKSEYTKYDEGLLAALSNKKSLYQSQVDSLYVGGSSSYYPTLKASITYPKESSKNDIYGVLLYAITVDNKANVSAKLLTKLDQHTEQEAIKAISLASQNWIAKPQTYTLYQPIIFAPAGFNTSEQPYSHIFENPSVLSPILITKAQTTYTRVEKQSLGYSTVPPGQGIPTGKPRPMSLPPTSKPEKINTEKLIKTYEKALKKEKWEKAYQVLNEAIRLNPFNKEYILKRNQLESQLGLSDYKAYDLAWFKALNLINATTL
ncbi:hypothetical protein [Roseivirga pacifica]|uniref:hypothetical protein n=1 Tax=Roseivirga pacifica TaxID=1267423 RepID=UPI003BB037C3